MFPHLPISLFTHWRILSWICFQNSFFPWFTSPLGQLQIQFSSFHFVHRCLFLGFLDFYIIFSVVCLFSSESGCSHSGSDKSQSLSLIPVTGRWTEYIIFMMGLNTEMFWSSFSAAWHSSSKISINLSSIKMFYLKLAESICSLLLERIPWMVTASSENFLNNLSLITLMPLEIK